MSWHAKKGAVHRDKAEPAIIAALEAVGASVEQLDVVDLLVGFRNENHLLEVKTPGEVRVYKERRKDGTLQTANIAGGKLSDSQQRWHGRWRGRKPVVVYTPEEALRAIGAIR